VKKASAAQAKAVASKWGFEKWRRPYKPEPCTDDECIYRFELTPGPARAHKFPDPFASGPTERVFEWFGLRPTVVEAWLQIRGKALRSASVYVYTLGRGCSESGCTILACAGTRGDNGFSEHDKPDVKLKHFLLHPSYLVGTHPTTMAYGFTGATVWAEFSPNADAADVSRLMQFDLGCLTRLRPCRDRDLMPTVWKQTVEDERESPKSLTCTPEASMRAAQLADVIVIIRPRTVELSPPRYQQWAAAASRP
jgi:hypothetical protein